MKKEASKKSMKWIWLVIGIVVLVAALAVGAFLFLGQGEDTPDAPAGGRAEIYWNVDRVKYTEGSATGLSTREPGADGLFHIMFAIDGQQVEYTVADKKLVNRIDLMDAMGLVFGDDGSVVDIIAADTLATLSANNLYVRSYKNGVLTVNSSVALNGMELQFTTGDLTGMYNCTDTATMVGEVAEPLAMDRVMVFQNGLGETTHVFITDRTPQTDVYWRVERMYDSTTAQTTRVPDDNGVYTIAFAVNGKQVELKCKDQALVTAIDKMQLYNCATGLLFDEEGYIVELVSAGLAIGGTAEATQFSVSEITETSFNTVRKIPGNNQGAEHGGGLTENTKVYNVNSSAEYIGEPTDLRLEDIVYCLINAEGDAEIIFVVNRLVDSPMYYNLSRKYNSTTLETSRTLTNGRYEFELASEGTSLTVWTKDKAIATKMDSYSRSCFGLKLGDNKEVLKVYDPENVTGYNQFASNLYVQNLSGPVVAAISYYSGTTASAVMNAECKVYDVSDLATKKGEPTELRVNDRFASYRNIYGEIAVMFVTARQVDGYVAWNLSVQYDSEKQETTREPDENKNYVYNVIIDGKERTVKTASKAIASKIDSKSPGAVGLQLSGDTVVGVYEAHNILGGTKQASKYYVKEFTETGFIAEYTAVDGSETWKTTATWSEMNAPVVYNVSQNVKSHRGEKTTLQLGDRIHALRDKSSKVAIVFVYEREVNCEPFMKLDRFYSEKTGSTREPDAEGWYVFQLANKGQVKTYKTKDKAIADKIDGYALTTPFAMETDKNGVITKVLPYTYIKNVANSVGSHYDIMSLNNSKTRMILKKNRQIGDNIGDELDLKVASNCKFYDMSFYSETFGQEVQPKVGDRVYCLRNTKGEVNYVLIIYRSTREAGYESECPHCDKLVWWEPLAYGASSANSTGLHYYVPADMTLPATWSVGNDNKDFETVLDLNGKTLKTESRGILVYGGDKLTIFDSSEAKTGTVIAKGPANNSGGGVLMAYDGAELTVLDGTYILAEDHNTVKYGGVIYVSNATMNIESGAFLNGHSNSYGGIIYLNNAKFSAKNATFADGIAESNGGILYVDRYSSITFDNCVLRNGKADHGGNVYVYGEVTFTDCVIEGGVADKDGASGNGGNIDIYTSGNKDGTDCYGGKVTLAGTTKVIGGKAEFGSGGNVFIGVDSEKVAEAVLTIKDQAEVSGGVAAAGKAANISAGNNAKTIINVLGGTIAGDFYVQAKTTLNISGTPVITAGSEYGLQLPVGYGLDVSGLKTGASIAVSTVDNKAGVFTKELASEAAAEAALKLFKAGKNGGAVAVDGKALTYSFTAPEIIDPNKPTGACPHCGQVEWKGWDGSYSINESGHYYVYGNVNLSSQANIGSSVAGEEPITVCLDLNGNTITSKAKAFLVQFGSKLTIMDNSTAKTGTVIGTSEARSAGVLQAYQGGELVVDGGTYKAVLSKDMTTSGGVIYTSSSADENSKVTINGGTFYGQKVKDNGGIIAINGKSDVVINGGKFISAAGQAESVVIYNSTSTLEINGGEFDGGVNLRNAKSVKVSGNPVIKAGENTTYGLQIDTSKVKIEVGTMGEKADIHVTADGIFTKTIENAEAAAGAFTSEVDGKPIDVAGGKISVGEIPVDPNAPTAPCPEHGQVEWTAWNGEAFMEDGHYYVASNEVELSSHVAIGDMTVCLDLNGKTITSEKKVFLVQGGGVMHLMDNSAAQEGLVVGSGIGNTAGVLQAYKGGKLTVHGGAYAVDETNDKVSSGGIIYVSGMEEDHSVVTIKGGVFGGANVTAHGGIIAANNYGEVVIEGGEFVPGTAVTGNNISIYGTSTLELKDVTFPGDISVTKGSVKLTGKVVIANGAKGGLILGDGIKVDATGLAAESSIALNATGVFTTDFADAAAAEAAKAYFTIEGETLELAVEGNALAVKSTAAATNKTCEHCGQEVEWTPWNGEAFTASGHYYAAGAVTTDSQFNIGSSKTASAPITVCLDLNGKTVSSTTTKAFLVQYGSELNVMDLSEEKTGTVIGTTGAATQDNTAGVMQAYNGGKITVYGGIYKTTAGTYKTTSGGIMYITGAEATRSSVTIKGGEFYGQTVTTNGGIFAVNKYSDLTIEGGTFHAGAAKVGDSIAIYGVGSTLELKDVTIPGSVYFYDGQSVKLIGKVDIDLIVKEGKLVDATGLAAESAIALTATGAFTTDFADAAAAEAAKGYFTIADTTKEITVQGNALAVTAKVTEPEATEPEATTEATEATTEATEATTAPTTEPEETQPAGHTALCPEHGQVEWTEWTGGTIKTSGHYYVAAEVNGSNNSISGGAEVCLDLNGQTVKSDTKAFLVNGSKLTLMDLSAEKTGTVIGTTGTSTQDNNAGVLQAYKGGELVVNGGTYKTVEGTYKTTAGGVIFASGAEATRSKVTINDGIFYGQAVTQYGGTVAINGYTDVVINGGTFLEGSAPEGDNLIIYNATSTLELNGGNFNGGVYLKEAQAVTISGNVTIAKGATCGLMINTEKVKVNVGQLGEDAQIVLNAEGVFTTDFADAAAAEAAKAHFTIEDTTKEITVQGNALAVTDKAAPEETQPEETSAPTTEPEETSAPTTEPEATQPAGHTALCPEHGQVEWTVWEGEAFAADGHYYIEKDTIELASHIGISNLNVCLDLNGKTVTSAKKAFLVQSGATMHLFDSSEAKTGTVIGTGIEKTAGTLQAYEGGKLTVHSGIYKVDESNKKVSSGGIIYVSGKETDHSVVTIKGGEFYGANVTAYGGIIAANNYGEVVIEGGNYHIGSAVTGNNISIYGTSTLELKDVTFPGDIKVTKGSVKLTGKVVIEKGVEGGLILKEGITVDATGLAAESAIVLTATGTFTTDFADAAAAEAAKGYFTIDDSSKELVVQGNALATADKVKPAVPAALCPHCNKEVEWILWDSTTAVPTVAPDAEGVAYHYYLAEDLKLTKQIGMGVNGGNNFEIVMNLYGYDIISEQHVVTLQYGETLSLINTWGKGSEVIGKGRTGASASYNGGVLLASSSNLNIDNVDVTLAENQNAVSAGGAIYISNGFLNIKNATITGGEVVNDGGSIFANKVQVTLENVTVNAGKVGDGKKGEAIYIKGLDDASQAVSTLSVKHSIIKGGVNIQEIAAPVKLIKSLILNGTEGGLILPQGATTEVA